MKLKIKHEQTFTPSFNGNLDLPEEERVKIVYDNLSQEDFVKAFSLVKQIEGADELQALSIARSFILQKAQDADFCIDVQNLAINDGSSDILDILEYPQLVGIIPELFTHMVNSCVLSEDEQKN